MSLDGRELGLQQCDVVQGEQVVLYLPGKNITLGVLQWYLKSTSLKKETVLASVLRK